MFKICGLIRITLGGVFILTIIRYKHLVRLSHSCTQDSIPALILKCSCVLQWSGGSLIIPCHWNTFFFFFGCTHSIWKFPGQGLNPGLSRDPSCCNANTGSLICCATRELLGMSFYLPQLNLLCKVFCGKQRGTELGLGDSRISCMAISCLLAKCPQWWKNSV